MRLGTILAAAALAAMPSAALADWHVAKSRHFIVYADDDADDLRQFAEKLEKFDSAARIARRVEDPPIGDGLRLTIYVLDDTDDVSRLAVGSRRSAIAGFYIPRAEGAAAFVPKRAGDRFKSYNFADTVFFHEYAHHLMFQSIDATYPPWVAEGFAEFFSTPEFPESGEVVLGNPAHHRATGLHWLDNPDMDDMLAGTLDPDTGEESEALYGHSWLLTHYLTFEPERAKQFQQYLGGIREGVSPLASAKAAFGDLRKLGLEVQRYLQRNKFRSISVRPAGKWANLDDIQVRPLTRGEAAIMPVRMRSHRGVSARTAPGVAEDARKIAARYPHDAFVQRTLAEAEFDVGNHAAALAAADLAMRLRPNYVEAMLYKARAMMALAKDQPASADWAAIRNLIGQANRLDREDPEPLMLFYESFGAAGQPATDNAVKGLLYAQLLAPQDAGLRMTAAAELVQDKKFADARRMIAPVAANPHLTDDRRNDLRLLVAALDAGNGAEALRLLAQDAQEDEEKDSSDD